MQKVNWIINKNASNVRMLTNFEMYMQKHPENAIAHCRIRTSTGGAILLLGQINTANRIIR